jgi:hypothetical protein
MVNIHDPVAGVIYMLNDKEKTAHKMKRITIEDAGPGTAHSGSIRMRTRTAQTEDVVVERHVGVHGEAGVRVPDPAMGSQMMFFRSKKDAKVEPLGQQTIEGLVCEGMREIHTIPVGEVGNDRPIETVTERWYSPELQTVVMRRGRTAHQDRARTVAPGGRPDAACFTIAVCSGRDMRICLCTEGAFRSGLRRG